MPANCRSDNQISRPDSDFSSATKVAVEDSIALWFHTETPTSKVSFEEYSSILTVTAGLTGSE